MYKRKRNFNCSVCDKPILKRPSGLCKRCLLTERNKNYSWIKGKHLSPAIRQKISASRIGEKNPIWRGDQVGYSALHGWVKRWRPRPDKCSSCKTIGKVDLANISQEYRRDLNDWEWLCRKCHMTKDGRLGRWGRLLGSRRICKDLPCKTCGVRFLQRSTTQRYCSGDCYHASHRIKGIIPCKACGKSFQQRTSRNSTCSDSCRWVAMINTRNPHFSG